MYKNRVKKMIDGVIDIHSHVLWGMDDGARLFDDSLDLCFMAENSGTKTLFLTPHLMYWDSAEELLDMREARFEELSEVLAENDSSLSLKKGFEIFCDDDIFGIKYFNPYTLNGSRYILIEFDFLKSNEDDVEAWCRYLSSFGLVPIIAHPERYGFVQEDIGCIHRLSQHGVLFQINAGSPIGMFGEASEDIAYAMLNAGYVDFLGSDAHDLFARNTDISECFDAYPPNIDESMLEKAALLNPRYILEDKPFEPQRKGFVFDK